ncbi:hypothetical protein [Shewanella gelidii]|uniref:Lipoprotein n=1 Tax=Shewanella gelidii TaxID=1642821 RepID=A0A917N9S8_9GAMM|nr:hypothetical protein [Shewanella gelidii]MCL1097657.1 hypothetical protein [Shewanella gelidii]GGI79841.1 hypothetical protein GCM10009332_16500 [Shewanella gelidii]
MKKGALLLSFMASLVLAGCSDSSDIEENSSVQRKPLSVETSPQYLAVIKCVDDQLYKGAEDIDEDVRKDILNDALALFELPKYSAYKIDKIDRSKLDMATYMKSYSDCLLSEEFAGKLNKIAKKNDYEFPEED